MNLITLIKNTVVNLFTKLIDNMSKKISRAIDKWF